VNGERVEESEVEEEAVTGEAGDMPGDGGVGDMMDAGELTQRGAFGDPGGDGEKEGAATEPVRGGEGA